MADLNSSEGSGGADETEVTPALLARLDQDVSAALDYLCAHPDEWGGRRAAARIRRHRRIIVGTRPASRVSP